MWNTFEVYGNIAQVFDNGNNIKVLVITNYKRKNKETGEVKEEGRVNMLTIWKASLQKFSRTTRTTLSLSQPRAKCSIASTRKTGKPSTTPTGMYINSR